MRWGAPDDLFPCWKVWERGAPHVAVEIASRSDPPEPRWEDKLEKYRRLGVSELVRFDPESREQPLRVWDSLEHDLVERAIDGRSARSRSIPGFWIVIDEPELGLTLRLSHDERGERLFLTPAERVRELEALLDARRD